MSTTLFLTLTEIECAKCGMIFGVTPKTEGRFRNSHESFYCPMGHTQWFPGKSEAEKLRDELTRQKQAAEQREANLKNTADFLRTDRDAALNRERAQKAAKTRLKNRIANGVCPCCTRSFQNLQRHIANQHPDFKAPEAP